jgi:uncharacterized protein (TIGR00295 family)
MLSYDEALRLLYQYGKEAAWIRHCLAVSRVAGHIAAIIAPQHGLDANYLKVGALLHDIGRYKTHDPILHGVEGYRLLMGLGHHREAFICASHVLCGMSGAEAVLFGLPEQDFIPDTLEQRLVPLIDGMVEFDRPTTLERRIASISARYKGNDAFLQRFGHAARISRIFLDRINSEFGISLEHIAAQALSEP